MSATINARFWVAFPLAALLGACSGGGKSPAKPDGGSSSDATTVPAVPQTKLGALKAGDCGGPPSSDVFVASFELTPCTKPHRAEVAGRYQLTAATYPGHSLLVTEAYRDCQPLFEAHVGKPFWDSQYDIMTITPSPSSWDTGDREVICLVVDVDGRALTTAAKDSRR